MITADKPFFFLNEKGNLEQVQTGDKIFTFLDPNTYQGKTIISGQIIRPVMETIEDVPTEVNRIEVGWVRVNQSAPVNLDYTHENWALNCDTELISTLTSINANNDIVFTSSIIITA